MLKSLLFVLLLSPLSLTAIAPSAGAQVAPIFSPYWYGYQVRIPGFAQKPARDLAVVLRTMNQALEVATAKQSLRCSGLSIKIVGDENSDLMIQGSFSCAQLKWNDLDEDRLAADFTNESGLEFSVLPPAGGGGGTIHN